MKGDDIVNSQHEIRDNKKNNLDGLDFNKDKTVILITGASGFIGSRLLNELIEIKEQTDVNYFIRGLSRHKIQLEIEKLRNSHDSVEFIEGDLSNYADCIKALSGVDIAYYLVHSRKGHLETGKNSPKENELLQKILRTQQIDVM